MSLRENSSFTYKVINKNIRDILDARSVLNNTVQVAMPFVRATTTLQHPEFLGDGNVGFTLGLHAINEDVQFEDIYSNQEAGAGRRYPLVGYTYTAQGTAKRIYASPPGGELPFINQFYNDQSTLVTTVDAPKIPPPGITSVNVGTNKNALSMYGQIEISVPSLMQLEVLHRTFLIPGVGMILEWGQQFAPENNPSLGELGLSPENLKQYMFPWYNRTDVDKLLKRLAVREVGIQEIMNCYTYPTQGQYSWMFGRVGNFSVKSNSDGSFDVSVKIIGQGEDSFAYLTKSTVTPPSDKSGKICPENENSVDSYFGNTVIGGLNFKTLLDSVSDRSGTAPLPDLSPEWKGHVLYFPKGNKIEGEVQNLNKPNTSTTNFGTEDDAYFITWRFFVNVVLNHDKYGIMAIFDKAFQGLENKEDMKKKIGLLRPYATGENRENLLIKSPGDLYINDPAENFVGNNAYLRSVDPGTLIIANEQAAKLADISGVYKTPDNGSSLVAENELSKKFLAKGNYFISARAAASESDNLDRGFLSTGVWLNHKAIVECMMSGDTILQGITNLLNRMNNATRNYWNLSLDNSYPSSVDPKCNGATPVQLQYDSHNYSVIDLNFRENSLEAVNKFLQGEENRVHVFNKYIRNINGELVGSELTDCVVDMSLPRSLYTAIATTGLFTSKDLDAVGNIGKTKEDQLAEQTARSTESQFQTQGCTNALVSDVNETLREMFSVVSISPKNGKSPDLTVINSTISDTTNFTCGKPVAQLNAETAGSNYAVGPQNANTTGQTTSADVQQRDRLQTQVSSPICQSCREQQATQDVQNTATSPGNSQGGKQLQAAGYTNGNLPQNTLVDIGNGKKLYKDAAEQFKAMQAAAASSSPPITLEVSSAYRTYEQQAELRRRWDSGDREGLSAQPASAGSSNHGWALAVDIRVSGRPQVLNWLNLNASRFGFSTIPNDLPHWQYTQTLKEPIGPPSNPANPFDQSVKRPTSGSLPNPTITSTSANSAACTECSRAQQALSQLNSKLAERDRLANNEIVRQFPYFLAAFRYVEIFPERMIANIRCNSDKIRSNAFGVAPTSLAITADLTMPGIAGLRVGELFWIDRIPSFYKAFGAFQIMTIEHNITRDGWVTKVHSRFNYLGDAWKQRMVEILKGVKTQNTVNTPLSPQSNNVNLFEPITRSTIGTIPKSTIPKLSPVPNAQNLQLRLPNPQLSLGTSIS